MKKTLIISAAITGILLAGCQKFLDIRPEASISILGLDYTKPENIILPISASYAKLRDYGASVFPYIGAFEIAADNADKGSTPEDNPPMAEINNFTYGASNALINNLWTDYFDIVSGANYAISVMPLFEAALPLATDKLAARQGQAECQTIRAYAFFNLTRLFGRVPIIDTILTAQQLAALKQASTQELYNFIEQDLLEAIPVLPKSYSSDFAGRITTYTAMGLKAKVHLYQQQYDSVASLTDRIISSGQFALLPSFADFFSIFGKNSVESLFEVQSSTLGKTTGDQTWIEYAYVQGPRNNSPQGLQGWGFCVPSQDLINFFNSRGEVIRPATTLLYRGTVTPEGDSIIEACTNPVYNGKVYTPLKYNNWYYNGYGFDQNVRVLRYADILLMYAEAKVRGATFPTVSGLTADDAINIVRRRAGLADLTNVTLQQVLDERRSELALEEDRFFDLVRRGEAATILGPLGFVSPKNNVYPIPSAQLQLNLNLTQNPGYQ
ncbi:MAG: RagB/SusD family nutrient uptake outer membrane protein [Bacteroidales bacterium]